MQHPGQILLGNNDDPGALAFPLSFAQQRLWFLEQFEPGSTLYHIRSVRRLKGRLHVQALRQSVQDIVSRHEALRTTFVVRDGQPLQVIVPFVEMNVPLTDLSDQPEEQRETEAFRILESEARSPFDFERGPLIRAQLLRLGEWEHIFVLTVHHIVSDGWSMAIVNRELTTLYAAYANGKQCSLPELPIQYADYAVWQRQRLQGEELERQLNYWRKQLAEVSTLELPTDRPRPLRQGHNGAHEEFWLSRELTEGLRALSSRAGVTLYMLLLGAFQAFLGRYSGQEDIAVGSPIAGRTRAEVEGLVGFFVNTLVMRTRLSGNPTFVELLHRVKETAIEAFEYQELPFEKLVEELHPQRDLGRNPLFQVMFILQNTPSEELRLGDLQIERVRNATRSAKFDLTLSMTETSQGLRGAFEYCADLFDAATIQRMVEALQIFLKGIVNDPAQPLSRLPLLPDTQRQRMLGEWNETQAEFPSDECIHELFIAQAARSPGHVAASCNGHQLTYEALHSRSNRLAHYLQELGIGPGVLVGICLERSLEMMVGLLGILKAGGAYVPLDPTYPKDRLAFMIEDAHIPLLLTQQSLVDRLPQQEARAVCVDTDESRFGPYSSDDCSSRVAATDLAYVIYTSGSTGTPKGVQITHRNAVNFLCAMQKRPGFGANDRLLAVTTISFDIHVLELFLPIVTGACVEIAPEETARDGEQLARMLQEAKITCMQATPATWQMLIQAGWNGSENLKALVGGEALSRNLASELAQRTNSLWNMYGPTETTVWSTCWKYAAGAQPIAIGKPIANTRVYILDRRGQLVPIGVRGELHIAGEGVSMGYLNQPLLTADRFVPEKFREAGPRVAMYRTGDLARSLPDGSIEYLGRIDHQVKIRGFRIELEEIEAVLAQCPGVRAAAVKVYEPVAGDRRLAAYVVVDPGEALGVNELRKYASNKLPSFMVPAQYVWLHALPLTPSGKVDRRALPAPDSVHSGLDADVVLPRNLTEETLARIWAEVLGIKALDFGPSQIDIHQNFFEAGGHSMSAAHLVARVRDVFQVPLPLHLLFESPTIEGLAQCIEAERQSHQISTLSERFSYLVPIQQGGSRPPLFLITGGAGGETDFVIYAKLVHLLGGDQPVYAFKTRGWEGHQAPHGTVEAMARDYIAEMTAFRPHGPYVLVGECMGGLVAFEMGQQLRAASHEVGVVLMNTLGRTAAEARLGRIRRKLERHYRLLSELTAKQQLSYIVGKLISRFRKAREERVRTRSRTQEEMYIAYQRTLSKYQPSVFSGSVSLILSEDRSKKNPTLGWDAFVSRDKLQIFTVPGNWLTYLGEHVETTADQLNECLARCKGNACTFSETASGRAPTASPAAEKGFVE